MTAADQSDQSVKNHLPRGRPHMAECSISGIASRFEVTQQGFPHLIASRGSLCLGGDCRRNRTRADDLEQRGFDRVINPQSAKSDAARLAVVKQTPMTGIARDIVLRAGVADCQLASAAATPDKTGEQGIAMLRCTMMPA